jgi:hydroxypyruvate reductase/glycerate 2-kinase
VSSEPDLRADALRIWQAGVAAADPISLVRTALEQPRGLLRAGLDGPGRILVIGGGKAGAAMAQGVEEALAGQLDRVHGIVNVPAETVRPLRAIRLHAARPAGVNQPTEEGVAGVRAILELVHAAGPEDLALCLLSGGGSALLPAPVEGVSLADKQQVTALLHACGATINEMNCVRKHLSAFKGGRLAQAFQGDRRRLVSLIISDVVGDPLDVIASGPTAADPTTFADALAVLERYSLTKRVPPAVRAYLERGRAGQEPETLETMPANVENRILGNNARSLSAAAEQAQRLGYRVLNLGSFLEGETRDVARMHAALVRAIRAHGQPMSPPVCILSGGETTVTLGADHGRGGRNQEFVLALLVQLGPDRLANTCILSGGTDGEDGPTDAAGACADAGTLARARQQELCPASFLQRHDAYTFFDATGDLLRTGLTSTNVMDIRVIVLAG